MISCVRRYCFMSMFLDSRMKSNTRRFLFLFVFNLKTRGRVKVNHWEYSNYARDNVMQIVKDRAMSPAVTIKIKGCFCESE